MATQNTPCLAPRKFWRATPLMLGALALLLLAVPATAHATDKTRAAAHDQSDTNAPAIINTQHIEGHIAFLYAELGITPDQEPLWQPVADAMHADVADTENAERQVAQQSQTRESAIQYLQNRVMFASLRAQGEARFLAAFEPLYQNMSAAQKSSADDLLISAGADE